MFLSKVQQCYYYTQLCKYRKEFVFKPISSQFNTVMGCNISFTKVLKCFLPWNGWVIFSRLNAIKEFATSFSSLTLHAVNLLLWKKILSLTLFKIVIESRPSTLLRVFLMGRLGCLTKGGNWWWVSLQTQKFELSASVGYHTHLKLTLPVRPLMADHTLEKIASLLDKCYQKFCLRRIFSATQSWLIWKSSLKLSPLIQDRVQQDYLPEIYSIILLNLYGKTWGWGRIPANSQKFTHFPH